MGGVEGARAVGVVGIDSREVGEAAGFPQVSVGFLVSPRVSIWLVGC